MWMQIHRLNRQVEEVLYPAMEDYAIDIMIGKGASATNYSSGSSQIHPGRGNYKGWSSDSTVKGQIWCGSSSGILYGTDELTTIIITFCGSTGMWRSMRDGAVELARRSRGTPRLANRLS